MSCGNPGLDPILPIYTWSNPGTVYKPDWVSLNRLPDEYAYRAIFHDAFVYLECCKGFGTQHFTLCLGICHTDDDPNKGRKRSGVL